MCIGQIGFLGKATKYDNEFILSNTYLKFIVVKGTQEYHTKSFGKTPIYEITRVVLILRAMFYLARLFTQD